MCRYIFCDGNIIRESLQAFRAPGNHAALSATNCIHDRGVGFGDCQLKHADRNDLGRTWLAIEECLPGTAGKIDIAKVQMTVFGDQAQAADAIRAAGYTAVAIDH
jgi:hypothetical protein